MQWNVGKVWRSSWGIYSGVLSGGFVSFHVLSSRVVSSRIVCEYSTNIYYYLFKTVLRFWLAEIQGLIPANQQVPTKYGGFLYYWTIDVNRPTTKRLLDDWRHATTALVLQSQRAPKWLTAGLKRWTRKKLNDKGSKNTQRAREMEISFIFKFPILAIEVPLTW